MLAWDHVVENLSFWPRNYYRKRIHDIWLDKYMIHFHRHLIGNLKIAIVVYKLPMFSQSNNLASNKQSLVDSKLYSVTFY